jgi:Protein of unknown function (DUF4058)
MPVHDWTRVSAGTFHDFHLAWIIAIRNALNSGLLPTDYYALSEQVAGDMGPDVLTLQVAEPSGGAAGPGSRPSGGGPAILDAPPKTSYTAEAEIDQYARRRRRLTIRHASDDRVVAMVEIVSPGNKDNRHSIRAFVDKAAEALLQGIHLLVIDLHPPGRRDPNGIHGAIWEELKDDSYRLPIGRPLTLASYSAGRPLKAFVEPIAVGESMPNMSLFLEPGAHVPVPLEATYQSAMSGFPRRWRDVLERA